MNQPLPADEVKRALQLFWINDILVKFLVAQGAKFRRISRNLVRMAGNTLVYISAYRTMRWNVY